MTLQPSTLKHNISALDLNLENYINPFFSPALA